MAFIVTKFDRISRNLYHFTNFMKDMFDNKITFVSITQPIDTTTFYGKMFLNLLCVFAQFEREMIADRTRQSHQARRKAGLLVTSVKRGQQIIHTDKGKEVIDCLDDYMKVKYMRYLYKECNLFWNQIAKLFTLLQIPNKIGSYHWDNACVFRWNQLNVPYKYKDINWTDWLKPYIKSFNDKITLKELFQLKDSKKSYDQLFQIIRDNHYDMLYEVID
jgi:DNA invertase Pin-like site-specific DNA recombinase